MSENKQILNFHLGNSKLKRDEKEGLKISKFLQQAYNSGYFSRRNKKFEKNRKFSRGRQPMAEFLDLLNVDGKEAFVNLDMKAPAIAPKFMQVIIGGFMKREEKVRASAVDPVSVDRKVYDKENAEFRMNHSDKVKQIEEQVGLKLMADGGFTPEDYEELELYFGLEYQLPEEILFEKGCDYVFHDNGWPVIKRKILEDISETGVGATKVSVANTGKINVRRVVPENLFYGFSQYDDFRDVSFIGEIISMKIVDIRNNYPSMTEEKIYELSKHSKQYTQTVKWEDRFRYSIDRPYDDWTVDVIDYEIKTIDTMMYQFKTNKYGNLIVEKKEKAPQRLGENKELFTKDMYVIYRGVYVLNTDIMLEWGVAKNMIKPSVAKEMADAYFSYSLYMFENLDLENMAIPERMETSIRQMTLAHLKIQQLIAKLRPSGLIIDIDSLSDINIGQGKALNPLELQKVYDQTGNIYYKRRTEDGEGTNGLPIQEAPNNGSIGQIQELILVYNHYLDRLRDEIGVNEYREGSGVNPKLGLGVQQAQIQASNNATDFLYDAYLNVYQQTAFKISLLLYDSVLYGGEQYRNYLNPENVEGKSFDVKIEVLPDDKEKMFMEQMIQTSLSAGIIEFEDAFRIKSIRNTKLAEMYLSKAKKRKQKDEAQKAQMNSEMNAQSQQQSIQMKAQMDAQLEQIQSQGKLSIVGAEMTMKKDLSEQEFVQLALLKSFELSRPLSPQLEQIVGSYFAKKQQEMMQQAMMQQMQAQQQQDPQAQEEQAMAEALNQKVQEESGQIAKEESERSGPSVTEEEMMNEEEGMSEEEMMNEEGMQEPETE